MIAKGWKLAGAVLVAPLMASCAQQNTRLLGPPIPEPLSVLEAADVARGHVGAGSELEYIDDVDNGQLFGITSASNSASAPMESRLLFVHDDGTLLEWPGR